MELQAEDIGTFLAFQFFDQESVVLEKIAWLNQRPRKVLDEDGSYVHMVESAIERAVLRELDVIWRAPIGILLSGWVDSFLLLYFLRKHCPDRVIHSYTLASDNNPESHKAIDAIARAFKTQHTTYSPSLGFRDILRELYVMYSRYASMPSADLWYLTSGFLFRKIRTDHPDLVHVFSGSWADVLFGGMEMYRYSLIENRNDSYPDEIFENNRKGQYFRNTQHLYEPSFFYKYGEYFIMPGTENDVLCKYARGKFHRYYERVSSERYQTLLERQIVLNLAFLLENRRGHVDGPADHYGFRPCVPFMQDELVHEILSLGIPNYLLVDRWTTKKIIRDLGRQKSEAMGMWVDFCDVGRLDFHTLFVSHRRHILEIGKYLLDRGCITAKYYECLPRIIDRSMWHEDRMRIYILLNLYFCIRFRA